MVDRKKPDAENRIKLEHSLGALLKTDAAGVDKIIDDPAYSQYEKVPVVTDVTADEETFWAENQEDFPGVTEASSSMRVYPYGQYLAAAHVLGYTGSINAQELAAHRSDGYTTHDTIGKTGVEQTFESELRGVPGLEKITVKSDGTPVSKVVTREPVAGHDVQLTIDIDTQKSAEKSLQQGIDGAKHLVDPDSGSYYRANAGAVIVLDARTGSVVAMASNPSYDPQALANGTVGKEFFDPKGPLPLLDRALNSYAPGSTFKTFTAIAMLQSGIRNANDTVDDEGCFEFGNNEKRCNAKKEKFFIVDLRRALTVSSDVYFYNVGNAFWNVYNAKGAGREGGDDGADHPVGYAMQNVARTYGFDEPTGVGLAGDANGRIPDLAFNRALNKTNPDQFSRTWRRGDSASLAVGQGDVLVTPLQLADAYAAFANGGTLYTPRLVSATHDTSVGLPKGQLGPIAHSIDPQVRRTTALGADTRASILAGLDGVVNDGEGTAAGAFAGYQGVHVAGKTGTAQAGCKNVDGAKCQDTSWFVAITNPDNDPAQPQYVVLTMVEQGGFGAYVAAPIARRVVDYLNGNPSPRRCRWHPRRGTSRTDGFDLAVTREPTPFARDRRPRRVRCRRGAALRLHARRRCGRDHHPRVGDDLLDHASARPRRSVLLRQASSAVRGDRPRSDGRGALDRLPQVARLLVVGVLRHRVHAPRGARAGGLEREGPPGVVPAATVASPCSRRSSPSSASSWPSPATAISTAVSSTRGASPPWSRWPRSHSGWCCCSPTSAP